MASPGIPDSPPKPGNGRTEPRTGVIGAVYADRCKVWSGGRAWVCALRGRLKDQGQPVVGDRVEVLLNDDGSGAIVSLLPRATRLVRKAPDRKRSGRPAPEQVLAANVERMVIVAAVREPPFRAGLVDRFLVAAAKAGLAPLICITKLDLDEGGTFEEIRRTYGALGLTVLGVAISRPDTLAPLSDALSGHTSILVGHSGVGKTSLLNLLSDHRMAVGELTPGEQRGRHTTSTAQLIPLRAGGFAIDSPGVREFGLHGIGPADLAGLYPDFQPHLGGCAFRDCRHRGEPSCAVVEAVARGSVTSARYESYLKLLEEVEAD